MYSLVDWLEHTTLLYFQDDRLEISIVNNVGFEEKVFNDIRKALEDQIDAFAFDALTDIYDKYHVETGDFPWDLADEESQILDRLAEVYTRALLFNLPDDYE